MRLLGLGYRALLSNFNMLKNPYKLTFAITYKCNSRCKTCNIWKKKPENELTSKEIKEIFKNINPAWINLTGGEPFLRRDIYEIIKTIKNNSDIYLLNLTTNGLLVNKIFNDIKKISKLDFPRFIVVVSLDGPEKTHDKIRGIEGNWSRAIELYKKLAEFSKRKGNFQTFLGYTISRYNIGLIKSTLNEVKKEIRDISINNFHFNIFHVSSIYYGHRNEKNLKYLKKGVLKDIDYVLKEKYGLNAISFLENKYLEFIERYLETGLSPLPCKALISSCFIDPMGNVYPCTHYGNKLGNLREFNYDLKKIWDSKKAREVRKLIKNNKCGGCWTPCEAYQTILGNLLKISAKT